MDGPGTYGRLPWKGSSKDASGTAAEDTISIGAGDRVSGADRMGMEVHVSLLLSFVIGCIMHYFVYRRGKWKNIKLVK